MHRRSCNELPTALAIFATTLVFIFWRPRGIREMWFTVAGALAMYGAGLIDWDDAVQLGVETGSVLLFLAGMLVVGFVADNAGVFAWLAHHAARWSAGSGRRLYIGIYAIGVFVTVWFSLDTTAVVLAPIVYSLVRSLQERAGDSAADDRHSHKHRAGEPGDSADPGVPGDSADPGSPGLLGPNLTVIGSLATMLSLSIIGRRGLRVPGFTYLKIGLITVPLLLVASVFGLWLASAP